MQYMLPVPSAEVINPVVCLGEQRDGEVQPCGSGVLIRHDHTEYLCTALHVIEHGQLQPYVRYDSQWHKIDWQVVCTSEEYDIAVLKTQRILDPQQLAVVYGEPPGTVHGQVGYALGFPMQPVEELLEVGGKPMARVASVTINASAPGRQGGCTKYALGYINAGFSGGAIALPRLPKKTWAILGIIIHVEAIERPVYCKKDKPEQASEPPRVDLGPEQETEYYVLEHNGTIGYVPMEIIQTMIAHTKQD